MLYRVSEWSHDKGLVLNAEKSKIMHVRPRNAANMEMNIVYKNPCQFVEESADVNIERVSEYKYLGILVDEKLKWMPHIENLQRKLRKTAFILNHLRFCTNKDTLLKVYYALGASEIWDNCMGSIL